MGDHADDLEYDEIMSGTFLRRCGGKFCHECEGCDLDECDGCDEYEGTDLCD